MRNLYTPAPRQVVIEMELFFKLQRLEACVRLAAAATGAAVGAFSNKKENKESRVSHDCFGTRAAKHVVWLPKTEFLLAVRLQQQQHI